MLKKIQEIDNSSPTEIERLFYDNKTPNVGI